MENSSNKRALTTIIIEIVVIVVIVVVFLFIFKVVSIPKSLPLSKNPTSSFPVSPSSPNVKMALVIYVLTGHVKSISLGQDNKYHMALVEFPNLTIAINKEGEVKAADSTAKIAANAITPGEYVQVGLNYDAPTQKWSEVPKAFKGGTVQLQPQNQPK